MLRIQTEWLDTAGQSTKVNNLKTLAYAYELGAPVSVTIFASHELLIMHEAEQVQVVDFRHWVPNF